MRFLSNIAVLLVTTVTVATVLPRCYSLQFQLQQLQRISGKRGTPFVFGVTTSTTPSSLLSLSSSSPSSSSLSSSSSSALIGDPHVETVLFIECGFGNDSHGQSATKAAVRACRNAIEFNSIPSVPLLVPEGYGGLKLDVLLAVPPKYRQRLELADVRSVFPYGSVVFQIQDGGMVAPSGIAIDTLGDKNEDMVVVCAAVTVGY